MSARRIPPKQKLRTLSMIHNRPIYHCQCCGAVVTQEPNRLPPFCCHQVMVKAAEETLREEFTPAWDCDPVPNGIGRQPSDASIRC